MIGSDGLVNGLRLILIQEASIPALHVVLFLMAFAVSVAWVRRRLCLTVVLLGVFGFGGAGYWLIQMRTPLGLGTDEGLSRQWAQVGVDSAASTAAMGFVVGTPAEFSIASALSGAGVPASVVWVLPQLTVLLCLATQILVPLLLFRSRVTGVFGAGLAVGGGLWPGMSPCGAALHDPAGSLALVVPLGLVLLPSGLKRRIRKRLDRTGGRLGIGLLIVAAVGRAVLGGAEPGVADAWLLAGSGIVLAPSLRALLRSLLPSPAAARQAEAAVLLAVLAGSGLLWWDPVATVAGFEATRDGDEALQRPMTWIRDNVAPGSVVLATPEYSLAVAALAGRRVLFPPPMEGKAPVPLPEPFRRNRLWQSILEGRPIARLAESFSATHLFLGPGQATPPLTAMAETDGEPRLRLVPAYEDSMNFRVFLLAKK